MNGKEFTKEQDAAIVAMRDMKLSWKQIVDNFNNAFSTCTRSISSLRQREDQLIKK